MKISFEKLFRIYAVFVILNILILTLSSFLFPELRNFLFSEDKLVENLTAFFFLMSFFIGIIFLVRLKEKRKRIIYIVIPLLGLVGFLDELSFGERILDFKVPHIYGVDFDALHDINQLAHKILTEKGNSLLYITLLVIFLFISLIIFLKYRKYIFQIPEFLRKQPAFGIVLIALSFLVSAQVFDLELIKPQFLGILEEVFEMNGAFTLLFGSLLIGYARSSHEELEQSPSKFEKTMPALVGAIVMAFFLLWSVSYFVLSAHTNKIYNETMEYVNRVIPLMFSSWNAEALVSNMPPDFSSQAFKRKLQVSFALHDEKLGKLINHRIIRGEYKMIKRTPEDIETLESFQYYAIAKFQKGFCNLNILIVLIDNKWYLYYVELKPLT